jgi:hypothetical protein
VKLTDLNPRIRDRHLSFDCPMGHPHRITVRLGEGGWTSSGDYPVTMTLTPSIHAHTAAPNDQSLNHPDHKAEYDAASECGWHGWITNGEIVNA